MKLLKPLIIGIMGMLVDSRMGNSITGSPAWTCTYAVAGTYQTIVLPYVCPITMMFN